MIERSDRTIAAWLGLFLLGIYLLSFSGRIYSQDGLSMFSVTESFVKRGEFNTDQLWTLFKARSEIASDGESYAKYGYATSLFAVPFYALALALPDLGLTQTALLTSAVVIAISGALVFLAARRLRYSRSVSLAAALLFGLATPVWVYAKQLWSEPYALFTLLAAFYSLACFRDHGRGRDALVAGAALGLAIATRVTNAALVPLFAWYGFGDGLRESSGRRGLALFALALALAALSIAGYDWARYGNPLATGYRADETFDNPILLGAYGLLFSPGKGLFVYVPFLAVLPFSAVLFYRRARREALLIGVLFVFYLLLFSAWYYWWGGTNWSPRFLVPTIPFLVLLIAPAVELALDSTHIAPRGKGGNAKRSTQNLLPLAFCLLFFALCLLAFAFELVGISIPSLAYRLRMVRLSANPEADAIFLPQFSPLIGYFNLLKPGALDFAWIRVRDNAAAVDWLVVVPTLAFIVFCLAALRRAIQSKPSEPRDATEHPSPPPFAIRHAPAVLTHLDPRMPVTTPAPRIARGGASVCDTSPGPRGTIGRAWSLAATPLLVSCLLALALALFSMYRYRDDPRFGGSPGYRALLQTVERNAGPSDVMILDDDVLTPFFLNENRARLRWYALSRDPAQWDDATRALLARVSRQYLRVWFAFDDSTAPLPDPTRDWLGRSLRETARHDFDDGVHLILFESK